MLRIAIYARKSVVADKGDSIKVQIAKCRDYIKLKTEDGEKFTFIEYKDEGYTGANTFRPDFQRLLRDIEQAKIDVLICYKLDRITRSVADFSDINKIFQRHKVNFVSVNENFDTTTPMGRAMLSIVLVFAQLEREVIGERIKDNMFELAKTDRWTGGRAPLGYFLHRKKIDSKRYKTLLVIDESTVPHVQFIFSKYLELHSMTKLETLLLQQHIKSRDGNDLSTTQLAVILKNPTYVQADERVRDFYVSQGMRFYGNVDGISGLKTYGKTETYLSEQGKQNSKKNPPEKWSISVGSHPGIIDADTWLTAQAIMRENHSSFPQAQRSHTALVSGILRCAECGSVMQVVYGRKDSEGKKGYYYVCKMRKKSKGARCSNGNARADFVDQAIINELNSKGVNKERFLGKLMENLKQEKRELTLNPVELIRDDIKKKETQIERLVIRISNADEKDESELVPLYISQIKTFQQEISLLYADLHAIQEKEVKIQSTEDTLSFVEQLLNKCGLIDTLELEEQRELVNALIKRITWNSKTELLSIKYIGNDYSGGDDGGGNDNDNGDGGFASLESIGIGSGNMSQFSSPSCDMIRNDDKTLIAQSQPFALHSGGNHFKSLARAHFVRQQGIPPVKNVGYSVNLVLAERNFRIHTHKFDV